MRYPESQRQWLAALERSDWMDEIRVDGRRNLLSVARHLMLVADWQTLDSMPGWDQLEAKTGLSQTTIGRWVQELKLRGWIVVLETGSTPLTRPMALSLPDGTVLSRLDEGNRRAVYALRIPLAPDEALRWCAQARAAEAAHEPAQERLEVVAVAGAGGPCLSFSRGPEAGRDQRKPGSAGDKKGWPTWSFPLREKTWESSYAREARPVDKSWLNAAASGRSTTTTDALRARLEDEQGRIWATMVPTSGFEMLIAADWLQTRLPVFARLTRKGARAVCRRFWAAGWTNLDILHALDHLPAAFGARAGTPIGRGPADHLDSDQAWWWITTRLAAWRDPDGKPRQGYYQTRGRRAAARAALVARHGRAALRVLPDPDLAGEQTLTPEHITRFARRVAAEIRAQTRAAQTRVAQPVPAVPAATRTIPLAAAGILQTTAAEQAARRAAAAAAHAAMMASHAPHIAAARAELAHNTAAGAPVPVAPAQASTPEQRYEQARRIAAGYRRPRHRRRHH